jgi:hypothetical protein
MNTELCHWCQEKFPSEYYFAPETPYWKRVCRECFAKLSPEERRQIVETPDPPLPETPDPPLPDVKPTLAPEIRGCLRCRSAMVSGFLTSRPGPIEWSPVDRRQGLFGWVPSLPPGAVSAWRCGRCGYCELATTPDAPGTGDAPAEEADTARARKRPPDDPSVL